jgi:hypothetical protein
VAGGGHPGRVDAEARLDVVEQVGGEPRSSIPSSTRPELAQKA